MSFEQSLEKLTLSSYKRLCMHQAVVEARLLASGGVLISKVLSIAADVSVTAGDVFTSEARYSGRVSFKVLYSCTEGKTHSMDYNADFTDKLLCDSIKTGLKPVVTAHILDTDIVAVDEREIKLACVVETALDAVMESSFEAVVGASEGVYTHTKVLEYSKASVISNHSFVVSDNIDHKGGKVLVSESRVVIKNRVAGFDSARVEGDIICDLVCEDEKGMLYSVRHITPFTEELSCPDMRDTDFVVASVSLNSHTVTIEASEDAKLGLLEFSLSATAKGFSKNSVEIIEDVFSVTNELEKEVEQVGVSNNICNSTVNDRVEGSVTLDVSMPIADSILALTGSKVHIASSTAKEASVVYDGIVSTNIVYYSAEKNVKHSVAVELPFSISSSLDAVLENDIVLARGVVSEVSAKIVRGNEISLKAEICIEVVATRETKVEVLKSLSLGLERALSTSAFSIHIARSGETLWDIAKALGITPESVLAQNPEAVIPAVGGERLMCYRQKK